MKIGDFDLDKDVLVVAEIGNNHEGNYALAEEMIGLAANAGVGAVKFQTFKTEHYISKKDFERFKRLKSFELTSDEYAKLYKVAKNENVIFLSTPFDLESASFLNDYVAAYKISSSDNNFYPLIEKIAKLNKPILLSTGLSDLKQIEYTKAFIEKIWNEMNILQDISILHCVTSYPVKKNEANLSAISTLKNHFNCTIGYSDHVLGIEASILAVALGARIIEKHFTINKHHSDFRDHLLSSDPEEMRILVERIKETTELLGSGKKILQESEIKIVKSLRRSIVASREIKKGFIIGKDDITWIRSETGFPAGKECEVLGRKLLSDVRMGDPLDDSNLL